MNVNPLIINALSPLNIPVWPDYYIPETGDDIAPDEYITFDYTDERDVLYGDDEPLEEETILRVHYFTKGDPTETKTKIRKLLRDADFIVQSTAQYYESDTGYRHIIITVSKNGKTDE